MSVQEPLLQKQTVYETFDPEAPSGHSCLPLSFKGRKAKKSDSSESGSAAAMAAIDKKDAVEEKGAGDRKPAVRDLTKSESVAGGAGESEETPLDKINRMRVLKTEEIFKSDAMRAYAQRMAIIFSGMTTSQSTEKTLRQKLEASKFSPEELAVLFWSRDHLQERILTDMYGKGERTALQEHVTRVFATLLLLDSAKDLTTRIRTISSEWLAGQVLERIDHD